VLLRVNTISHSGTIFVEEEVLEMFMIVKYGDGKEQFFNTECKTRLLLDCIKEKCDGHNDGLVDLADENGEIMFLQERVDHYGNEFLKPRGIYVLMRRENCDKNYPQYTPLLNDDKVINANFLRQLNMMREEAMKKVVENQKANEPSISPPGKGKIAVGKKVNIKEVNSKRTPSSLVSNGRKFSKRKPSR